MGHPPGRPWLVERLDRFAVLLDVFRGFFWLGLLLGGRLLLGGLSCFGEVDVALQRGVVFNR